MANKSKLFYIRAMQEDINQLKALAEVSGVTEIVALRVIVRTATPQ